MGRVLFWPDSLAECGELSSSAGPPVERQRPRTRRDGADHLHSVSEFKGYTVHALDGDIGHVENLLADDANWDIRYLVVATRNWWPGKIVQLSPYAVKDIDWYGEQVDMKVTRDQVRSAPPGTGGHGGQGERGRAPPPFRLAGLWQAGGLRAGERQRLKRMGHALRGIRTS